MEEIEVLKKHYLPVCVFLQPARAPADMLMCSTICIASGVHPMRLVLETKKL